MSEVRKILVLTGPTATGKTDRAIQMALVDSSIEIINADSMLVYRGMDIGTAKPTLAERQGVPHHLIDICNPDESFTAADFKRLAENAIEEIQSRGKWPLIVGGTGFYLKALLYGLWEAPAANPKLRALWESRSSEELFLALRAVDPRAADRIGANDRYRLVRALEIYEQSGKTPSQLEAEQRRDPDPRFDVVVMDWEDRGALEQRIRLRAKRMLDEGLIEETQALIDRWGESIRPLSAVGYAQVVDYLGGVLPQGRMMAEGRTGLEDEIFLATRQLVKRQRTWFKGQKDLRWDWIRSMT